MIPLLAPHAHIAWQDAAHAVLEDPAAPQTQVLITHATPAVVRWLRSCNGTKSLTEVLETAASHGLDIATARDLLDALVKAGLLTMHAPNRTVGGDWSMEAKSPLHQDLEALALCGRDANLAHARRQQHRIVLEGANRVAHALVDVLAAAHVGAITVRGQRITRRLVTLRDVSAFGPAPEDVGLSPSVALRRHIERAMPKPAALRRRPVVVVVDAHSDPGDEVAYQAAGVPYLRVLTTSRFATIGPLTLPGHTVCWSCIALHRSDVDPHWPHLLAQFDQHRKAAAPVDSTFAISIASEAAARLLEVIDTDDPSSLVNTTLHFDRADSSIRRRQWRIHPDCPCQWRAALPN